VYDFTNKHKTQVDMDSSSSNFNAMKYADKLYDAFSMLSDIESLLSGVDIKKKCATDCILTTLEMPGKDFRLQLLFSKDSEEPLAVKLIEGE